MRKYERAQCLRAAIKTVVCCIGWVLLGYLVMTDMDDLFWLGWLIMSTSLCVGAYAIDRLIETI